MKIGLVCPYIYPENGGVAQHVRLPVREPAPARPRRADHHRQPRPAARVGGRHPAHRRRLLRADQRLGGHAHLLAALHQPGPRRCSSASGSTCSTSTSRSCRSCRCSCCASRRSVNVATFHAYAGFSPSYELGSRVMRGYAARLHGRIAVSAAARHFIDRFFPGDYKVIPNGVDIAALRGRGPDRALAGRHAERPVRRPARAAQGPARPAQGAPDPAQDRLREPAAHRRLRAAGARGAPLRRHPRPAGRRVPRPRHRTPRRPSSSGPPTCSPRRRPAASRSGSSCSRRWPPARRSSPPTSTATRASSAAAARACSCRRTSRKELAVAIARLLGDPALRAEMSAAGRQRAEEFSWPRVTAKVEDYYGFVIRRLAATRLTCPADFRRRDPSGAARSGRRPSGRRRVGHARSRGGGRPDSASASRQTHAE